MIPESSDLKKRTNLDRFRDAFRGLFHAIREEPNMRIYGCAIVLAVSLGFYFSISTTEWAVVVLTIVVVIAAEIFNTGLEAVVDLASPGYHKLAGIAKDCAAGATLLLAIGSVIIAALIFVPHVIPLIYT